MLIFIKFHFDNPQVFIYCSTLKISSLDMIFSLYIFNRECTCLHYQKFGRDRECETSQNEEFKLIFGLVHNIRAISKKFGPNFAPDDSFRSFSTNAYKLTLWKTPTGIQFIGLDFNHDLFKF